MKKRFLGISLTIALVLTMIPCLIVSADIPIMNLYRADTNLLLTDSDSNGFVEVSPGNTIIMRGTCYTDYIIYVISGPEGVYSETSSQVSISQSEFQAGVPLNLRYRPVGKYLINYGYGSVDSSSSISFEIKPIRTIGSMCISASSNIVGVANDGSVFSTSSGRTDKNGASTAMWRDIVAISEGADFTVGLKYENGTVLVSDSNSTYKGLTIDWIGIVDIDAGNNHIVGLKSDGTVVAVSDTTNESCNVSTWTNIVDVSAGGSHTVGVDKNGYVFAVGSNTYGQCDVSSWRNITAVSAGENYTVGLKSDCTVVTTGTNASDFLNWTNIIAVSAGNNHTVGLKSDGTVVAVGEGTQCNVSNWTDIIAVSAGIDRTVGLKSDGTVVSTDTVSDLSSWQLKTPTVVFAAEMPSVSGNIITLKVNTTQLDINTVAHIAVYQDNKLFSYKTQPVKISNQSQVVKFENVYLPIPTSPPTSSKYTVMFWDNNLQPLSLPFTKDYIIAFK